MKTKRKYVRKTQETDKNVQEDAPTPGVLRVLGWRACKNPTMLTARHGEELVVVKTRQGIRDRLVGKRLIVKPLETETGTIYEYVGNE